MNFSFELTGDRGAALVTRHPTYCEDSLLDSAFEEYTVRHYESWVAFARYKQYGNNVHPVLVSGVDMTRDFAMVAYSNRSTFQEPGQTIAVPMFASASGSFRGTWRTRCLAHTNHGPQQSSPPPHQLAIYTSFPMQPGDERSTTSGFVQCVFVRYYTMRSKGPLALFPKVIRASGGPHDLGPGDNTGNTFPELLVQSGAEPATTSYGGLGGQWDLTCYVFFAFLSFFTAKSQAPVHHATQKQSNSNPRSFASVFSFSFSYLNLSRSHSSEAKQQVVIGTI